ncbi:MAG TPA: sensor domain-containing diguanylate cyclase [Chloroflexota bacterium]|jgi:diguanylate cyclase (GGDEF)-like protein
MSRQANGPVKPPATSPAAEVDWRSLYESAEAQRVALAEQVHALEQVRQQLANYADDLNHTYQEFRRRLTQMRVLHEVNLQIGALLDAEAVMQATVDALQRLVPTSVVHIFLQEASAYEVQARLSRASEGAPTAPPSPAAEQLVRDAMSAGQPRADAELESGASGLVATLAVPLRAQGRALGALCLVRDDGPAFNEEATQLAELCAAASAAALANAALYEQSQRLAATDPLTGLYNRRSLEQLLDRELDKAHRLRYPVGVLVIDVDHFKTVNDTLGHLQGDKALGSVGRALRRALRKIDALARFGGDEFVALLPGCDPTALRSVAEKLRAAVANRRPAGVRGVPITVSIGGAAAQGRDAEATALLEAADTALYRAKEAGRNRVVIAGDDAPAG